MRRCGPRARFINVTEGSIATRQQATVDNNREIVDSAGDLAIKAGSPMHGYEVVTAKELIYTKSGPRLSKRKVIRVPVWTSPAVVLEEVGGDQLKVAVTKIDEIGRNRRARLGLFVVGRDHVDTTNVDYSAQFATEQQQGWWLETYSIGGYAETHRVPEDQIPQEDEINVVMSNRWLRSGAYLSGAEARVEELRIGFMDVVASAIESNAYNQRLKEHLSVS